MNKLFKWEGIKKELFWIFFILFIAFISWSYFTETNSCREMIKTPCFDQCRFEEGVTQIQQENPGLSLDCDYESHTCTISGVYEEIDLNDYNIVIVEEKT